MCIFFKRARITFALALLISTIHLSADTRTWTADTSNDLTINTNWAPAITPIASDDGIFNANADNFNPLLSVGNFSINSLNISGAQPYTFTVDNNGSLSIGNNSSGGIFNTSTSVVTLDVSNEGIVGFNIGSTADAPSNTQHTSIQANNSSIDFVGAIAGNSLITLTTTSLLRFIDNTNPADAQNATIKASGNSEVDFFGTSTASNSTITLNSASILKFDFGSNLSNATIALDASTMTCEFPNPISTATVSLTNNSTLNVHDNLTLGSLASDLTSTIALDTAILTIDNTNSTTIAGSIQGTASSLVKSGPGTLTLTGVNNYGPTAVNQGTLVANSSSLSPGNFTLLDGTLQLDQNTNGSYAGSIQLGTGSLVKTGLGTIVLTGNSGGFAGTTSVLQGTLGLNNLLGGNLTIDQAGILQSDNGTVRGNLTVNNGAVNPHGQTKKLNVGGNYIQNATGTYAVEFSGLTGLSSLINVTGTAKLAGTLSLTLLDGVVDPAKIYPLLHADGSISDVFQNVVIPGIPTFVPHIIYLPNDVKMTVEFVLTAATDAFNEQQVSKQLQTLNLNTSTPDQIVLFSQLLSLVNNPQTIDQSRSGMASLSGEQYTNIMLTADVSGRQFIRRLYEPVRMLVVHGGICKNRDVFYNCYESNGCVCLDDEAWVPSVSSNCEPWLEISGRHSFLRHDNNARGYKSNNYQITFGVQQTTCEICTIGLAGGYEHERIHYNLSGTCNNENLFVGLYTLLRPAKYYLLADLAYEWGCGKVKRPITVGSVNYQARSKPTFCQGIFYGEIGTDLELTKCLLQPFFGLEVNYFDGRKVTEHHADPVNLAIGKRSRTSALTRLGVHFGSLPWCSWTFNLDLAWQYRLTSVSNHVHEHFQDFGHNFKIKGVRIPRNSIDGSARIAYTFCDCWDLFAEISGERWQHGSLYNVLVGVKYTW